MIPFITRYKYIVTASIIALFIVVGYLIWDVLYNKPPSTQPVLIVLPTLPISSLPNNKPGVVVFDKASKLEETSGDVYSIERIIPQSQYDKILKYWALPEDPMPGLKNATNSSVLYWSNQSNSIAMDLKGATLTYENNSLSTSGDSTINSLDDAFSYGIKYLMSLPFFSGHPVPFTAKLLMQNGQLETITTENFDDADFIVLSYRETVNGIPLITKDSPSGNLYTITINKKGAVASFNISFLQIEKKLGKTLVFLPSPTLEIDAKKGNITIVDIADIGAFVDRNSLKNNTVHITSLQPAYLLDADKKSTRAVYLIDGYVDYLNRKVSITGLYPASTR